MPRNMSFFLTQQQLADRTKDVTRRRGTYWTSLAPGDLLYAVEKTQGLAKGEQLKRLALIRVVSTRAEPLDAIDAADVAREGFPELTPAQFVAMFCRNMHTEPGDEVTRIEFEYVLGQNELAELGLAKRKRRRTASMVAAAAIT